MNNIYEQIRFLKWARFNNFNLNVIATSLGRSYATKKVQKDIKQARQENREFYLWLDKYIEDVEKKADLLARWEIPF